MTAVDVTEACRLVQWWLDSWTRFQRREGAWIHPAQRGEPGAEPAYFQSIAERLSREPYDPLARFADPPERDERPYFRDPVPITWRPEDAFERERREQGVRTLAEVWADPLARTLWLAIKQRFLASQHFNAGMLGTARALRDRPPRTAEDLHISLGDCTIVPYWYKVQLWPYVVFHLREERRWPYMAPPPALTVDHGVRWEHVRK